MNFTNFDTFDTDISDFNEKLKARVAGLSAASGNAFVQSGSPDAGPRFYLSDPLDECVNALGHLADPWSVVRVTAYVGAAQAYGMDPSLTAQGEFSDACDSFMSFARLGSGDQTVVFPTAYAAGWLPKPGVYELKLMRRRAPGTPDDALMVHRLSVARKGQAVTPWGFDHLGLPEQRLIELHRVLASMKPVHQAVCIAAISRPDIEHKLTPIVDDTGELAVVPDPHTLSCGVRAAMALCALDLNGDEASLARLACLISDLGALPATEVSAGLKGPHCPGPNHGMQPADARQAHPRTAAFLRSLLSRFAELEPEDAAYLEGLLGTEAHRPFRIGSKQGGPFSDRPVDPVLARMGCAMGDALSQTRSNLFNEMRSQGARAQSTSVQLGGEDAGERDPVKGAISNYQNWPAAGAGIESRIENKLGTGSEASSGKESGAESGDVAVIPLASIALSPDDLRLDLDEFDEGAGAPRPSLAWAAGMLDGDGCIAIIKQPFANRRPIYRLTVSVCQNCLQTLEHFRRCVGVDGVIYAVKRKLEHNKQVYTLNYSGPKALLVIQRLRAYLVRKRPEALVAISFCLNGQISRRFGPHGVPADVEAVRVAHYLKLRALK